MWKWLKHRSIVPLLGVVSGPLRLVSEWMPSGVLTEHLAKHPDADRFDLVCVPVVVFDPTLTPAISCLMSLMALLISTPAT